MRGERKRWIAEGIAEEEEEDGVGGWRMVMRCGGGSLDRLGWAWRCRRFRRRGRGRGTMVMEGVDAWVSRSDGVGGCRDGEGGRGWKSTGVLDV
jgi:hypothetical protein